MQNDKRDIEATKAALLSAAEALMESCSDPADVTSRAITKKAGVNLSMINYCFGSREALLYEVYNSMKQRAIRQEPEFARIITGETSPKEKLIGLHFEFVKLLLKNYKYARAVVKYILLNRKPGDESGSLRFIMEHYGGSKPESECRLIAYELSALHQLLVLRHEDIKAACGIDLTDDETLKKIITENINRYLN